MKEKDQKPAEMVVCPFCGSTETEMIALFGMQMMTSQYYCRHCHSAFEAVKWNEPRPGKPGSE
jgi:transposase-like protein